MGGFQAIWFLPSAAAAATGAPPAATAAEQPVAGIYRAASDHRKDGEAVGW
jgi:gamma-glutamyltranspeptidase / glutathione hydrolase